MPSHTAILPSIGLLLGAIWEMSVKSIDGVEHVYTQAQDHGVMVTARFNVGQDPEAAATRVDEKIKADIDHKHAVSRFKFQTLPVYQNGLPIVLEEPTDYYNPDKK